jgi:hypothetical protein
MTNKHRLYEYKPHEFSPDEKRFLSAAGWAAIAADDLIELAAAVERERPPEIERVTFLTRELLMQKVFVERRRAYHFARAYVHLLDAGTDFRLIVWDWD